MKKMFLACAALAMFAFVACQSNKTAAPVEAEEVVTEVVADAEEGAECAAAKACEMEKKAECEAAAAAEEVAE